MNVPAIPAAPPDGGTAPSAAAGREGGFLATLAAALDGAPPGTGAAADGAGLRDLVARLEQAGVDLEAGADGDAEEATGPATAAAVAAAIATWRAAPSGTLGAAVSAAATAGRTAGASGVPAEAAAVDAGEAATSTSAESARGDAGEAAVTRSADRAVTTTAPTDGSQGTSPLEGTAPTAGAAASSGTTDKAPATGGPTPRSGDAAASGVEGPVAGADATSATTTPSGTDATSATTTASGEPRAAGPAAGADAHGAVRTADPAGTDQVQVEPVPATDGPDVPSLRPEVSGTAVRSSAAASDVAGARQAGAVDRVLRAIEHLEHAPPPRQLSFEVDGIRMTVALRGEGVTVDVQAGRDLLAPTWQRDLQTALGARGFDLASGRDGAQGRPGREQAPPSGGRRRDAGTSQAPDLAAATPDDPGLRL